MNQSRAMEILVGLFVVLGVSAALLLTFRATSKALGNSDSPTYALKACFRDVGELKIGTPVKVAGVRIGTVSSIAIGCKRANPKAPDLTQAEVVIQVEQQYKFPEDSTLSVKAPSLLGGVNLAISYGGLDETLGVNQYFDNTEDFLSIVDGFKNAAIDKAGENKTDDSTSATTTTTP